MLLDLFITHWTEPWEVGAKNFRMIAVQQNVDWEQIRITLVHDGTDAFPDEYFADIPCGVNQVCIPHGGIAKARNWCIDHSEAKWIKWNDFDDMFFTPYSLNYIMNVLGDERNQMLWFDMLHQDHKKAYIRTERNPVFIHDKVFRTDFLRDNQIRFNEELTWCEDSAFLAVIEMEIDHQRIGKIRCDYPIYLYIVRDGSLCNRPEIRWANLQSFFARHCYVADEFMKRGLIDEYRTMMVRIMGDSYYALKLAPCERDHPEEHEKRVWEYFDRNRGYFYDCKQECFDLALEAVNRENYDGGVITKESLMAWIHEHERGEA